MKYIVHHLVALIIICTGISIHAQENQHDFKQFEREITDSIYSQTLDSYRHFWVKLPENFNPKNSAKYPVLYLLDGFFLKPGLETVYNNYIGHYMPHMILVGISNQKDRTRDLTISKVETRRGATMRSESGGAELFTKFIASELIPHIDKRFPTTTYRTLIGHSYGGLFTINTLIHHSDLFTNYIAIDPSIEWDNQKLLKEAKTVLKTKSFERKGLFVALAAEQLHMQDASVTIDNLMEDTSEYTLFSRSIVEFSEFALAHKQNGLRFSWNVYPEDLHGTVPLPAMRDGLIALFEWYQFKSPQIYNNPKTSIEDLVELLKQQEKIYSENFGYKSPPMVEELLNAYGYMNLHMEQPEKAFLFFDMAVKYYPESANVYDSMADYHIAMGNNLEARKCVEKAYAISGNDYHREKLITLKD